MALYSFLPVYKVSYDLLVDLFVFTKEFNKEYKYTVGESIKKETIEMIVNIYRANSRKDKVGLWFMLVIYLADSVNNPVDLP